MDSSDGHSVAVIRYGFPLLRFAMLWIALPAAIVSEWHFGQHEMCIKSTVEAETSC